MSEPSSNPPTYEPQRTAEELTQDGGEAIEPDKADPKAPAHGSDAQFDPQSLPNTPGERQEQNAATSLIEPSDASS